MRDSSAELDTRAAVRAPAPRRLRVPIAYVQLAVLFCVLAVLLLVRNVDPDFWWHVRTGELIFDSGIPRHDVYSWTAAGRPWVAHEWLSELIMYAVEYLFGYIGNIVLFGTVAIASLLTTYTLARRAGAGTRVLVLLMILAVVSVGYAVAVRPQIFSWLFFATFLFVLDRDYRGERRLVWWLLPALTAIWVNLHLGFVYGLLLVATWSIAVAMREGRRGSWDFRRPLFIAAACLLATVLNPHGLAILIYPLRYVQDRQILSFILEWQRPNPLNPLLLPYFVSLTLMAWAVLSKSRPDLFLCLSAIALGALSMQALRNVPYAGLMLLPVVGPAIARAWPKMSREHDSHTTLPLAPALALVALLLFSMGLIASRVSGAASFLKPDDHGFPAGGARYARENLAGGRLYNDYTWGGYLIYETYPEVRVFVDGRSDFYRTRIMGDYVKIGRLEPGWQDLVDSYGINAMLLRKDSRLARHLREDAAWKEVFTGDVESVFTRAD